MVLCHGFVVSNTNVWQGEKYFHSGPLLYSISHSFTTTCFPCFLNTTQQQRNQDVGRDISNKTHADVKSDGEIRRTRFCGAHQMPPPKFQPRRPEKPPLRFISTCATSACCPCAVSAFTSKDEVLQPLTPRP